MDHGLTVMSHPRVNVRCAKAVASRKVANFPHENYKVGLYPGKISGTPSIEKFTRLGLPNSFVS